jgi:hypothetical protein
MKRISLVVNVDTREGWDANETVQDKMFNGTRSYDFIFAGVENKIKAFTLDGYELETTLFIDIHNSLPNDCIVKLNEWVAQGKISNLILNRNKKYYNKLDVFQKFNDLNYLNAIVLSRGEYVIHCDGDMAAFVNDKNVLKEWIDLIDSEKYDYICYPSRYSPAPIVDPDFPDYWWASTRFFICRKSILDYSEILKCLCDSEYLYGKYGDKKRRCPWIEHVLGIIAGKDKVFYPKMDYNKCLIFSWSKYTKGTLDRLNNSPYLEVVNFVSQRGGIQYPCDVRG